LPRSQIGNTEFSQYPEIASQIIIGEAAAVAVRFQPVVKVDLIQVGGDYFFTQLVRFDAQKRYAKSRERCD
jgi:hypothetical protein